VVAARTARSRNRPQPRARPLRDPAQRVRRPLRVRQLASVSAWYPRPSASRGAQILSTAAPPRSPRAQAGARRERGAQSPARLGDSRTLCEQQNRRPRGERGIASHVTLTVNLARASCEDAVHALASLDPQQRGRSRRRAAWRPVALLHGAFGLRRAARARSADELPGAAGTISAGWQRPANAPAASGLRAAPAGSASAGRPGRSLTHGPNSKRSSCIAELSAPSRTNCTAPAPVRCCCEPSRHRANRPPGHALIAWLRARRSRRNVDRRVLRHSSCS